MRTDPCSELLRGVADDLASLMEKALWHESPSARVRSTNNCGPTGQRRLSTLLAMGSRPSSSLAFPKTHPDTEDR